MTSGLETTTVTPSDSPPPPPVGPVRGIKFGVTKRKAKLLVRFSNKSIVGHSVHLVLEQLLCQFCFLHNYRIRELPRRFCRYNSYIVITFFLHFVIFHHPSFILRHNFKHMIFKSHPFHEEYRVSSYSMGDREIYPVEVLLQITFYRPLL